MSKLKKMTALLTALTMTASMGAVSVSACNCYDSFTFIDNVPWYVTEGKLNGFIVETDGAEVTADMFDIPESDFRIVSYEEFLSSFGIYRVEIDFSTEKTAYVVTFGDTPFEETRNIARKFMLEHDCAEQVYNVNTRLLQYVLEHNYLQITVDSEEKFEELLEQPEFSGAKVRDTFKYSEGYYYSLAIEQFDKLLDEGKKTWEVHGLYCELSKTIDEKFGDEIKIESPMVYWYDGPGARQGEVCSIWDNAGDSNSDGAVDASDAANVLTIAAQNGTGANIKATAADDVNADGAVNAADAAAVLCYAAAKGTGADVSWVDILRR